MVSDSSFDLSPVAACVDAAFAVLPSLEGAALDHALMTVERSSRRMTALRSAVIARSLETARFKADGHRRAGGWVAAMTGSTRQDAGVAARVATALSSMPYLAAAFAAGSVSFETVETITRRITDERVVDQLIASDVSLTGFALGHSTDDVRKVMSGWDRLVDPAGAADAAVKAHERRRVRIVRKDGEVRIYARFGAAQGEEMAAIHARFVRREFERDAAAAVDGELPRTADQRSADALAAALRTADDWITHDVRECPHCGLPMPFPTGSRDPLVNIVFDEESLRRWGKPDVTAPADGPTAPSGGPSRPSDAAGDGALDLQRLLRFAAGTSDGAPVPADDIVRAMILGRVRVIVRRSDGVITHIGRRQRLFRGLARDAAILQSVACTWAGCTVPASECQADHLHPHADGGATGSANGGPLCGHHNRFKAEHGFRTERDAHGRWHVLRPDGSPTSSHLPPEPRAGPDTG